MKCEQVATDFKEFAAELLLCSECDCGLNCLRCDITNTVYLCFTKLFLDVLNIPMKCVLSLRDLFNVTKIFIINSV